MCEKNGSEKEKLIFIRSFPYHENYVKGTRRRKKKEKKRKNRKILAAALFRLSLRTLSVNIFPHFHSPGERVRAQRVVKGKNRPEHSLRERKKQQRKIEKRKKKRVRRRGNEEKSNFFSLSIPKSQCIERASAPQQHYTPR